MQSRALLTVRTKTTEVKNLLY